MNEHQRIAELERQLAELRSANSELAAQVRVLREQRKDEEQRLQRLAAIVEASRDAVWSWDTNGLITYWNNEAERLLQYAADEMIGRSLLTMIPSERLEAAHEAIANLRDGGWIGQFETTRLRKDGVPVDVEMTVSPIRDAHGQVVGAATVCRDITKRREAEARQQLLIRELDHRVKNTVSTVLALMHQTQRSSADVSEFTRSFEARLRTLVNANDAVMKNDFVGAQLQHLIEAEMRAFCPEGSDAFVSEGDDVLLHWRSAQMICLAIHELAANAARHGALSVEGGRVRLASYVELSEAEQQVRLDWREENGPSLMSAPSRRGFGLILLERGLPAALNGTAALTFAPDGVRYQLLFPVGSNVADSDEALLFSRTASEGVALEAAGTS